jgi:hypothetical protein
MRGGTGCMMGARMHDHGSVGVMLPNPLLPPITALQDAALHQSKSLSVGSLARQGPSNRWEEAEKYLPVLVYKF